MRPSGPPCRLSHRIKNKFHKLLHLGRPDDNTSRETCSCRTTRGPSLMLGYTPPPHKHRHTRDESFRTSGEVRLSRRKKTPRFPRAEFMLSCGFEETLLASSLSSAHFVSGLIMLTTNHCNVTLSNVYSYQRHVPKLKNCGYWFRLCMAKDVAKYLTEWVRDK